MTVKPTLKPLLNNLGLTTIELLVATSVIVLVLAGIASGVSFAVKNTTFSKEKTLSVRYAQEGMEWIRRQRELLGWRAFYQVISADGSSFSYCLDNLTDQSGNFINLSPISGQVNQNNCDEISNTAFIRSIGVTVVNSSRVDLVSQVSWYNGSEYKTTTLQSSLYDWK